MEISDLRKDIGHPVETRSAETIIPPIASRDRRSFPSSWTQPSAGKLPAIFTNLAAEAQSGAVSHPNKCHLELQQGLHEVKPLRSRKTPASFSVAGTRQEALPIPPAYTVKAQEGLNPLRVSFV